MRVSLFVFLITLECVLIFPLPPTRKESIHLVILLLRYLVFTFSVPYFVDNGDIWSSDEPVEISLLSRTKERMTLEIQLSGTHIVISFYSYIHTTNSSLAGANINDPRLHPLVLFFLVEMTVLTIIAFVLLY